HQVAANLLRDQQRRIIPNRRHQNQHDQQDFEERRGLPPDARRKRPVADRDENHGARGQKQDVSAQHQNREPPRYSGLQREHEVGGRKQQLIGNRIEVRAQRSFLIQSAREDPVEAVADSRGSKNSERGDPMLVFDGDDEERQKGETEECELVGNGEDARGHWYVVVRPAGRRRSVKRTARDNQRASGPLFFRTLPP